MRRLQSLGPIVPGVRHSSITAACPVVSQLRDRWRGFRGSRHAAVAPRLRRPARRRHRRPYRSASMLASAHLVALALAAAARARAGVAWASGRGALDYICAGRAPSPCRRPADLDPEAAVRPRRPPGRKPPERSSTSPTPTTRCCSASAARSDPAYALAWMAARRWPHRFRVVVQEGELGLNPKVNQLVTLARHARHDILVISDSNTRVARGLPRRHRRAPRRSVGGPGDPPARRRRGERGTDARLGAIADNLHITGVITPRGRRRQAVARARTTSIGKSMAMRRADLDAAGRLRFGQGRARRGLRARARGRRACWASASCSAARS